VKKTTDQARLQPYICAALTGLTSAAPFEGEYDFEGMCFHAIQLAEIMVERLDEIYPEDAPQ
jgi:hypothetical protein